MAWRAYGELHGLDAAQLFWATRKNAELAQASGAALDAPCSLFSQEYPATSAEAFTAGDGESLIRPEIVMRARKAVAPDQSAFPLIFGVDVARGGRDKTRVVIRRGRCAGHLVDETIDTADLMQVVGAVGS